MAQATERMKKNEMDAVARSAMELAEQEISALREKVEALIDERISPTLSDAAAEVEQAAQKVTGTLRHQTRALARNVKAQPFAAIGAAALVGVVVGLMLRR